MVVGKLSSVLAPTTLSKVSVGSHFLLPAAGATLLGRFLPIAKFLTRSARSVAPLLIAARAAIISAFWPSESLVWRETETCFWPDSWSNNGLGSTSLKPCPLLAWPDLADLGGRGIGKAVIGFRDRTDVGGTSMILFATAWVCDETVLSLTLSFPCSDDPLEWDFAKGFLDAEGLADSFKSSQELLISVFATRCRSESILCIF